MVAHESFATSTRCDATGPCSDDPMEILGVCFVGTRTPAQPEMARFARDVLGLTPDTVDGIVADLFTLPDGSSFAVTDVDDEDDPERTIGLLVADLDVATAELRAAGVEMDDEVSVNERYRYLHFRAPDGRLCGSVEPQP